MKMQLIKTTEEFIIGNVFVLSIQYNHHDLLLSLTLCLALEGFGVVGLLGFGVVGLLLFGVVGLLDRDPVRRSGNRYGETARLSSIHAKKDCKFK